MRLPRRQPRAVYVVRDADDLLGDSDDGEAGERGQPLESQEAFERREGQLASEAKRFDHHQRICASRQEGVRSPAMRLSRGLPVGRVLIGALLCLIAVLAVALIVLALLSLAGRQAHGERRPADPAAIERRPGSGEPPWATAMSSVPQGHTPAVRVRRPVGPRPRPRGRRPRSTRPRRTVAVSAAGTPVSDAGAMSGALPVRVLPTVADAVADEFGFER